MADSSNTNMSSSHVRPLGDEQQVHPYLHGCRVDVGLKSLVGVREVGERVRSVGEGGERVREHEASGGGGGGGGLTAKRGEDEFIKDGYLLPAVARLKISTNAKLCKTWP